MSVPVYPIYDIHVSWFDDVDDQTKRNGTSFSWMEREDLSIDELWTKCLAWWGDYRKEKGYTNPSTPDFAVGFVRRETWCPGWFNHWTFDIGQSDEEVLASFNEFVSRMEERNRQEGRYVDGLWKDAYCLMGAEDRWRWCGSADGSAGLFGVSNRTEAPCRCDGCKKHGVIRICH